MPDQLDVGAAVTLYFRLMEVEFGYPGIALAKSPHHLVMAAEQVDDQLRKRAIARASC